MYNFQIFIAYNFFLESLRISQFPFPLWKKCEESIEYEDYDGSVLKIERGMDVLIATHSYHSHPDFYPNATEFNPERFDESNGGVKKFKDAGVLMPFGVGPRMCIGMRFAIMQMKTAIYEMVKIYRIIPKRGGENEKVETIFTSGTVSYVGFEHI